MKSIQSHWKVASLSILAEISNVKNCQRHQFYIHKLRSKKRTRLIMKPFCAQTDYSPIKTTDHVYGLLEITLSQPLNLRSVKIQCLFSITLNASPLADDGIGHGIKIIRCDHAHQPHLREHLLIADLAGSP